MVQNGWISTVLVSFTVLYTLSREKVFLDTPSFGPFFLPIMMLFYFVFILCLIGLFLYHLSNPRPCQYAVFPVVLELIVHMCYHL